MKYLREAVRYGYAPFMMFGLTGAAYWVVSELVVAQGNTWAYLWLAPLLGDRLCNFIRRRADRAVLRRMERP